MDDGDTDYEDEVDSVNGDVEQPSPGDHALEALRGPHRNDHEPSQDIDDDQGYSSESEDLGSPSPGPCSARCTANHGRLERENHELKDQIMILSEEKETVENKLANMEKELRELRLRPKSTPRCTARTWPGELKQMLEPGGAAYCIDTIYRLSCLEENMSPKVRNTHPNLRLRGMNDRERARMVLPQQQQPPPPPPHPVQQEQQQGMNDTQLEAIVEDFVESIINQVMGKDEDEEDLFMPIDEPLEIPTYKPALPQDVWARVFRHFFDFGGRLVHCISRLDPFEELEGPFSEDLFAAKKSGLLKRFHISNNSCNITAATKPNELLALFRVCKLWYFLGAHSFYGQNTFAFSSLGEFGRFCNGIGAARRQRIQSVELLWMGSQHMVFPIDEEGQYISRRTWHAHWLTKMPRLQNLVVHIHESDRAYTRRGHERVHIANFMAKVTVNQPNYRLNRSLRTVQGIDFVYQLRGMKSVLFYDFSKYLSEGGGRHVVRDWTFLEDVWKNVSMPERHDRKEMAKLRNLANIVPNYEIQKNLLRLIRPIFHEKEGAAFDDGRDIERNLLREPQYDEGDSDDDDAEEKSSSGSESDSDGEGGNSDDESNNSDEDSDDDDGDQGIKDRKPTLRSPFGNASSALTSRLRSLQIGSAASTTTVKTEGAVKEMSDSDTDSEAEDSGEEEDETDEEESDDEDDEMPLFAATATPIIDLTGMDDDDDSKPAGPPHRTPRWTPETEYLRNRGQNRSTPIEIDDEDDNDASGILRASGRATSSLLRDRHKRSESSEKLFVDDLNPDMPRSSSARTSLTRARSSPSDLQVIHEDMEDPSGVVDEEDALRISQAWARTHPGMPTFATHKRKTPDEDDIDSRARKRK